MKKFLFFITVVALVPLNGFATPEFQSFLDRFPTAYCERFISCDKNAFPDELTCVNFLRVQIFNNHTGRRVKVKQRSVDKCLEKVKDVSCRSLKKSLPKECKFLGKL